MQKKRFRRITLIYNYKREFALKQLARHYLNYEMGDPLEKDKHPVGHGRDCCCALYFTFCGRICVCRERYTLSCCGQRNWTVPKLEASRPYVADGSKINIVALGDSLTEGVGDISTKGYVKQVQEKLTARNGKPVYVLNNFAVSGYRTDQLLNDLTQKKKQIGQALAEADLIMLTIGGNDIFNGGKGIFDNPTQEFNVQAALERMPEALIRLDKILKIVGEANPRAKIMYIGLYHPFLDIDANRDGSAVVEKKWNNAAFGLANRYPNMIMVPTYDLFRLNGRGYLADDHFHPNGKGYERIADRIVNILE